MNNENLQNIEKIFIIQPILNDNYKSEHAEAISLIESADALYIDTLFQKVRQIHPATFVGEGKLKELKDRLAGLDDITVLFNGELSPSQTLNISATVDDRKVIDRTTLILDIFARRAQSSEGKLQVELAQLKYLYPRLKGKGTALSRLGGGIGTRGPGETQLETDRRHIRLRIDYLEQKLSDIKTRRSLQSSRRKKNAINTISLIGYTNTGKSTLLNALTGADVYAENKLFATLDPTSRRTVIDGTDFIITDTVGFLQALPHTLIEAFHSTLQSAADSDLALVVCDATDDFDRQLKTTLSTLEELSFSIPYIVVMNKCENIRVFEGFPRDSVFISAKYGIGLESLKSRILSFFRENSSAVVLEIPYSEYSEYTLLKKYVVEKSFEYLDSGLRINAVIDHIYLPKFQKFIK